MKWTWSRYYFPVAVIAAGDRRQGQLRQLIAQCESDLERFEFMKSESEEAKLREHIVGIMEQIPGPCQPEQLLGEFDWIDENWTDEFQGLMQKVLGKFQEKIEDRTLRNVFLMDNSLEIIFYTLNLLTGFKNKRDFVVKVDLLKEWLKSDTILFCSFVFASSEDEDENMRRDLLTEKFVTALVNCPTKVANFGQSAPVEFMTSGAFLKVLLRNWLKAAYFVAKSNWIQQKTIFKGKFLAQIWERLLVDYNENRSSKELINFLKIISIYCEKEEWFADFFHSLLKKFQRTAAMEIFLVMLLCNVEIFPPVLLKNISSSSLNWNFVIMKKIPLLSYSKSTVFVKRYSEFLIVDLSFSENKGKIKELLIELLSCWSQKEGSSIVVALDQHLFISQLILHLVEHLDKTGEFNCQGSELSNNVRRKMFDGMSLHLQSLDHNLRFVGMRMAEVVLNCLEKSSDNRLCFETDKMAEKIDERVRKVFENGNSEEKGEHNLNLNDLIDYFNEIEVRMEQNTIPINNSIKIIKPMQEDLDSDDEEEPLDEDDDLKPYDMSNDTEISLSLAPKYLLDLKECLLDNTDDKTTRDKFELSLQVAVDLIEKQLPLNEPQLGIDLLNIFINLTNKIYNENFLNQRFEACLAVVVSIPVQAAEYLCHEFYTENGQYAVSSRILMLEILGEAAKKLSSYGNYPEVKGEDVEKPSKGPLKLAVKNEELERRIQIRKVIYERLEKKTRRFKSKSKNDLKESENKFHKVAGSFLFPLVHGFGRKQLIFKSRKELKDDSSNILLLAFLKTISVIVLCSENAPIINKIIQETFHLIMLMRYYPDSKIQYALLELLGCVFAVVPKHNMDSVFMNDFIEMRSWLEDLVDENNFNPDFNKECKDLAKQMLNMV